MWILGNSFLRGFYSTHDMRRNKFGFAVHASSTKDHPRYDVPASQMAKLVTTKWIDENKGSFHVIIILCVIGALGLGIGLYFLLKDTMSHRTKPFVMT